MTLLARAGGFLVERQRGLLILLLGLLHLAMLAGDGNRLGLVWWLVDVGLFMLWQPFVRSEKRLGVSALSSFALLLLAGVSGYGAWLLLLWATFLIALVGGRVLFVEHRGTRLFYLLAFGYLLAAILLYLVPQVVPSPGSERQLLETLFVWSAPIALLVMALLPIRDWAGRGAAGPVDFVYSLFVFLLVAVLVLGSVAFMVIRKTGYVESLLSTVLVMGAMLLLLGWAWNPRPGFGGVGVFFSRYLLTVGLPFEQWLHRLTEVAGQERDPGVFLGRVLQQMMELPWVVGGAWEAAGEKGQFGSTAPFSQAFSILSLRLQLHTRYRLSPALIWHFRLLIQLVAEYHMAKLRERELEQMSYLRAVYETGARLTHDVKNLLQTLNNLCYVAQSLDESRAAEIQPLMQRQLPVIVQRLELTLEKLRRPRGGMEPMLGAEAWWSGVRQRFEPQGVCFEADCCLSDVTVPTALFDSVADNLVQNALEKRMQSPELAIVVCLQAGGDLLSVSDNGAPLPDSLAAALFSAPVASETGLGIGLYHAARQAEALGYDLRLAENQPGEVRFELRRQSVQA
ncbi:MAG: HAMP domain-containing histidine kinase [Betaproteobacteria bacterium]|nr:HAMP domain-containing histidine kinase [Betaproteobacteria bacterium]